MPKYRVTDIHLTSRIIVESEDEDPVVEKQLAQETALEELFCSGAVEVQVEEV